MQVFHTGRAVEKILILQILEIAAVQPCLLECTVAIDNNGGSLGSRRAQLDKFRCAVVIEVDQSETLVFFLCDSCDMGCIGFFPRAVFLCFAVGFPGQVLSHIGDIEHLHIPVDCLCLFSVEKRYRVFLPLVNPGFTDLSGFSAVIGDLCIGTDRQDVHISVLIVIRKINSIHACKNPVCAYVGCLHGIENCRPPA